MGSDRYDSDVSRGNWDGGSYSEELELKQNDKHHDLAKKKKNKGSREEEEQESLKKKSDGVSEIKKNRKLDKEKALQLSKIFEELDNNLFQEENQDKDESVHHDLAGAVVLTLKDQSILVNGDINEDVDVLENIEIEEQKQRDEAYKAAKKKTNGVYDYNFHDEYDPTKNRVLEDLNIARKISSDYYTQEEMLVKFKKTKKKKALRKKEMLDIDAIEAEAISAGLGAGDLGSRNDAKRQAIREEEAKCEAEKRNRAYQLAYAKEVEASNKSPLRSEEFFADDEDDLYKPLIEQGNWPLKNKKKKNQLGNGSENEAGQRKKVIDASPDEKPVNDDDHDKDEIVPDETMHEVAVGKGLSGALKLLKDRGTVKEWGDRNMDNKKRKVVGIENDGFKDIRIERIDEFGRTMTQKEAFKKDSHKFHGKNPGKRKQEKRMKKYQEELKLKQMNSSDTPSLSMERIKEAQIQLKTPYLVLGGQSRTNK
ncbi:SART-1 protein [Corchorus capsularis]|uniref:SART-1 protein n=1 Tax=Corchorus capsularis TaxID=210143 RepID=A0A1R3G6F5_COCAP|nr:SART-1 protein [Corchorus capsularis]